MKKLLLVLIILLLTASFEEIGKESRLGKILQMRSIDSFLANVSFWINEEDEPKKLPAENKQIPAETQSKAEAHAKAIEAENSHTQENPMLSYEKPHAESQTLAEALAQNMKQNDAKNNVEEHINESSIEPKANNNTNEIINSDNTEEQQLEELSQLAITEENNKEEKQTEEKKEVAEVKEVEEVEEEKKPSEIQELTSANITIDPIKVTSNEQSYSSNFIIRNTSDAQQSGKINFFLVFDDNTKLAFDDIGATYRTRYQVDKNYQLTKTSAMQEHLAKTKAKGIAVELIKHEEPTIFLRKILGITQ